MKYIITGGAGFIGTNLIEYLLEHTPKIEILIIDNLSTGSKSNIISKDNIRFIQEDLQAIDKYETEFIDTDVVIHLAAHASVLDSVKDPLQNLDSNVIGTVKLFEVIKKINPQIKVVQASTAAVYGDLKNCTAHEELTLNPISPYAICKLTNEIFANYYNKSFSMNISTLRFFNVYGPHQKLDSDYAGAITIFLHKIKHNEEITIFGDGSNSRDYIYVKDICKAIYLTAQQKESDLYNVATGTSYSLNKLIDILKTEIIKKDFKVKYVAKRPGDILFSKTDATKIKNNLGFKCDYDLLRGLKEIYEK